MKYEREEDYESRFLTKEQLKEFDEYRSDISKNIIYAPHSIHHGYQIHDPERMPFANETLLKIELNRLYDFLEFLFSDKEYCDHANQSDAWDDFEQWEYSELLSSGKKVQESDTNGLNQGTKS